VIGFGGEATTKPLQITTLDLLQGTSQLQLHISIFNMSNSPLDDLLKQASYILTSNPSHGTLQVPVQH